MSQLTSPQNKDLFQRVIVESGVAANVYPDKQHFGRVPPLAEAEQDGVRFFRYLGVSTLAEARAIDEVTLRNKIHSFPSYWGTVQDDLFCLGEAMPLFCRNKRYTCPVLMGHTASEFFVAPEVNSVDEFKAMAQTAFAGDAPEFLSFFDLEHDSLETLLHKASVCSIELAVRVAGAANAATVGAQPLYYYDFDAEIPGWDHPGTFHSVDLWFFFETLAKCWRPFTGKHYDLARQMCTYWANFITNGDPNGKDADGEPLPAWQPYTPGVPSRMVFGDKAVPQTSEPSPLMQFLIKEYRKERKC
jgi:para-nitrobenzyl esterase